MVFEGLEMQITQTAVAAFGMGIVIISACGFLIICIGMYWFLSKIHKLR